MNVTQGEGRGEVASDKMRYRGRGRELEYIRYTASGRSDEAAGEFGRGWGLYVSWDRWWRGGVVRWVGGGDGIRKVGGWPDLQG